MIFVKSEIQIKMNGTLESDLLLSLFLSEPELEPELFSKVTMNFQSCN